MELRERTDKGQVFVMAAILFSSLTVLLFVTTMDVSPDQTQNTVKEFYENIFNKAPEKLNNALKDNYSIESARNSIYSYSRFVERSSTSKGIDFSASYLIVMPQKGKSVFINYRSTAEEIRLHTSGTGWRNTSVPSNQYLEKSFSPGQTSFRLIIPDRGIDRKFTASSSRIFTLMKLSAPNQIWINSELS